MRNECRSGISNTCGAGARLLSLPVPIDTCFLLQREVATQHQAGAINYEWTGEEWTRGAVGGGGAGPGPSRLSLCCLTPNVDPLFIYHLIYRAR